MFQIASQIYTTVTELIWIILLMNK